MKKIIMSFILTVFFYIPVYAYDSVDDCMIDKMKGQPGEMYKIISRKCKELTGFQFSKDDLNICRNPSKRQRFTFDILAGKVGMYYSPATCRELCGKLSQLKTLKIEQGSLEDISPLKYLTKIVSLNLDNNRISDINPLKGLTQLTFLRIRSNDIQDISSIKSLTNLKTLLLDDNHIIDINPVRNLTNLEILDLNDNQIIDINPIRNLTNLAHLDLKYNKITDISSLKGLTKLFLLSLIGNPVKDYSPIKNHPYFNNSSFYKLRLPKMVLIPAGEFEMGSNDIIGYLSSMRIPVHKVYLNNFYIDKFEVTVGNYRNCIFAGACQEFKTKHYGGKDQGTSEYCNWTSARRGNHPMNCVDWKNARNYCKYAGKRLPTEAEWEKAATWKNNKKYKSPTGKSSASCANAVLGPGSENGGSNSRGCGKNRTWPVGSKPIEINGTYDMTGNVSEWVEDWYGKYSANFQRNPVGPSFGSQRVTRGGTWQSASGGFGGISQIYGVSRNDLPMAYRYEGLGFRCVTSP